MRNKLEKEIRKVLEDQEKIQIKLPNKEIEKKIETLLREKKIESFEINEDKISLDVYIINKLIELGNVMLEICTLISFSKILNYYYIDYFFKLGNLDKKIFYVDNLYGDLGEESSYVTIGVLEDLNRELKLFGLKLLEKKEIKMVLKDLPDLEDNAFFTQPTVEAVLFYDLYDLLD